MQQDLMQHELMRQVTESSTVITSPVNQGCTTKYLTVPMHGAQNTVLAMHADVHHMSWIRIRMLHMKAQVSKKSSGSTISRQLPAQQRQYATSLCHFVQFTWRWHQSIQSFANDTCCGECGFKACFASWHACDTRMLQSLVTYHTGMQNGPSKNSGKDWVTFRSWNHSFFLSSFLPLAHCI
jgi:hypothetical protein